MSRATQMAEEARARMLQDMDRQRQQTFQGQQDHNRFVESLQNSARFAAATTVHAASAAGTHVQQNMMLGGAIARDQLSYSGSNIASAFGFGGGIGNTMPISRGYSSPNYYAASQSFGGLFYEAGLGDMLRGATGGLFFRDVGQMIGAPAAQIRQQAQQELMLRGNQFFRNIGANLPFAGRMGIASQDIYADRVRELAQQFSGVRTTRGQGGLVGGRGFGVSSRFLTEMEDAEQRAFREINKEMGYSLSDQDAAGLGRIADAMMTDIDRQRMADMGGKQAGAKREQIIRQTKQMLEDLRMNVQEGMQFVSELRGIMNPEEINDYVQDSLRRYGQSSLQISRGDYMRFQGQFLQSGIRSGMGVQGATNFAQSMAGRAGQYQAMANDGVIDRGLFNYFGGAGGLTRTTAMLGAQAMQASPHLMLLAGGDPTAFGRVLSGQMGYMGAMTQAGAAMAANPFAQLEAQFDPSARANMQRFGMRAAYFQAGAAVREVGLDFGPGSIRAQRIQRFMEQTGMNDPVQAMYLDDIFQSQDRAFAGMGLKDPRRRQLAANIYDQLSDYGGTMEQAAELAGTMDVNTDVSGVYSAVLDSMSGGSSRPSKAGKWMYGPKEDGFGNKLQQRDRFYKGTDGWWRDRRSTRHGGFNFERWIAMRKGNAGLRREDVQAILNQVSESGASEAYINEQLRDKDGNQQIRLNKGKLELWDPGDKKYRTINADDDMFGTQIGDEDWERSVLDRVMGLYGRFITKETEMTEDDYMETSAINKQMTTILRGHSGAAERMFGVRMEGGDSARTYLRKILGDDKTSAEEKRLRGMLEGSASSIASNMRVLGSAELKKIITTRLVDSGEMTIKAAQEKAAEITKDDANLTSWLSKRMKDGQLSEQLMLLVGQAGISRMASGSLVPRGSDPTNPVWIRDWKTADQ